ncbi:hypothetical protein [Maribacter sp. 2210JD10-5]|uniref:hypothetical protein n=1 Tax=Maribacter sp. 2210JD10-5 TaxID=3386272 RepID=UPI0039BD8B84
MENLFKTTMVLMVLALTSCSVEPLESNEVLSQTLKQDAVIGVWQWTDSDYSFCSGDFTSEEIDRIGDEQRLSMFKTMTGGGEDSIEVEFKVDGTYIHLENGLPRIGEYTTFYGYEDYLKWERLQDKAGNYNIYRLEFWDTVKEEVSFRTVKIDINDNRMITDDRFYVTERGCTDEEGNFTKNYAISYFNRVR